MAISQSTIDEVRAVEEAANRRHIWEKFPEPFRSVVERWAVVPGEMWRLHEFVEEFNAALKTHDTAHENQIIMEICRERRTR